MKKIYLFIIATFIVTNLFAQAPQKMSYQAVIRNAGNNLVTNTSIGMRISILQGSASGSSVYIETQTSTTNANGLVSLEIGTGTTSDNFSAINWGSNTFFIKTETDPAGGTNYTITGTTQLLSVPYALHAKSAESISGSITETDPVFNAAAAKNITTTDITNWNNKQNAISAGTGITLAGTTVSAKTYAVGDFAHGGIVIWVDESGQHGIVCAKQDQSSGIRWYAGTTGNTWAKGDGPYAGKMNTAIIVASQKAIGDDGNDYAARMCVALQITEGGKTYGDWYLPSKTELNLIYQNRTIINSTATSNGGTALSTTGNYWSSTEGDYQNGWEIDVTTGNFGGLNPNKSMALKVRAVRAF